MKYICVAVICAVVLFIGCYPMINNFETAQVTPTNKGEILVNYSPCYFALTHKDNISRDIEYRHIIEITAKLCIIKNIDIGYGLRFDRYHSTYGDYWFNETPQLFLNTKYQFLHSKKIGIDGAFSLKGSFGTDNFLGLKTRYRYIRSSLLISNEKPKSIPFRVALGLNYWREDADFFGLKYYTGLNINFGVPVRFGENRLFRIMPDIGVYLPLPYKYAENGYYYSPFNHEWNYETVVAQIGISFAIVGR